MRIPGISGRKHHHLIGVTSVVIVVAAATGGYVGVTSGHTRPSTTDGQSGRPHVADASSPATGDGSTSGVSSDGSRGPGAGDIACPMIPATGSTGSNGPVAQNAGIGSATHVFTRTTADGVTVRTYRLAASGICGCGPLPAMSSGTASSGTASSGTASSGSTSSGSASAEAVTGGAVSVELSDDTAVGVGTLFDTLTPTATTANAGGAPVDPATGVFGVTEGAPVWWTALSVGADVASARMTFADGSTDQMAPVDGVVVLAHHIDANVASSGPGPDVVRGTLRLLDSSGAVLTTVSLPEPTSLLPTPPFAVPGSPPVTIAGPVIHAAVPTPVPTPTPTSGAAAAARAADGAMAICSDVNVPAPSSEGVASPSIAP